MNAIDKLWDFAISKTDIRNELATHMELAESLGIQLNDVIQTQNALEINRLREALLSMWVVRHQEYFSHTDEKLVEHIKKR